MYVCMYVCTSPLKLYIKDQCVCFKRQMTSPLKLYIKDQCVCFKRQMTSPLKLYIKDQCVCFKRQMLIMVKFYQCELMLVLLYKEDHCIVSTQGHTQVLLRVFGLPSIFPEATDLRQ
jgi:hypothetical protein